MQFGVNTFVWAAPFNSAQAAGLFDRVRDLGFDIIEIAVEAPDLIDLDTVQKHLQRTGLSATICGVFGPDRELSSADDSIHANAKQYTRWCIDAAAAVGSPVVCGPVYSSVGKARLESAEARRAEWMRSVSGLQELCDYAAERDIRLALEPLNRFETDMINVVDQGLRLIEDVGSPQLGFHLDSFHMHLEEKNLEEAIVRAGDRVFHVHACENDRGVPGTGQVHWDSFARGLKRIGYNQAVVIESFTPEVTSIARAVCIWREIAPSQDAIAREGLAFLRQLLA